MALLKCRHCETEIESNARKTRCPGCGQLFPFACAVCEAPLRPPFPVFEDERYLNADESPLCAQHFQRQCPKCKSWFAADENPGYFLCRSCMEAKETEPETAQAVSQAPVVVDEPQEAAPVIRTGRVRSKPSFNFVDATLTLIVFLAMVAVVVILGWQIFVTVRGIVRF